MARLLLLLALTFSLAACADSEDQLNPTPDATPELADPDPDTPLDVDPLSRPDGQTMDDQTIDPVETGDEIGDRPLDGVETPEDAPPSAGGDQ